MHQYFLSAVLLAGLALTTALTGGARPQHSTIRNIYSMQADPSTRSVRAGQPVQITFVIAGAPVPDQVISESTAIEIGDKAHAHGAYVVERPGS